MARQGVDQFHRMSSADGAEMENVIGEDSKLLTGLLKNIVIATDHERQRACRCANRTAAHACIEIADSTLRRAMREEEMA